MHSTSPVVFLYILLLAADDKLHIPVPTSVFWLNIIALQKMSYYY